MRIIFLILVLAFMATHVIAETQPTDAVTDPQQVASKLKQNLQQFSIEKLYMTRNIGGTTWSPDGKQVAFTTNISGRMNIWTVPAEGGWPKQLTVSDQRQFAPAWSPDGKWIAYMSDYDGNEQWDLFLVSTASGEVMNLTQTPEIAEERPTWSPDGKFLAFTVKPKVSPTHEIYVMDMLTKRSRALTTNTPRELSNTNPLWSRDGKWLAYTQAAAHGRDSNVFVLEVARGKATNVTPHSGEQVYSAADWSADGRTLLVTSNAGNGYDNVALLDVATKKLDWLTQDKWEISAGNFSPDGKRLTWTANVDGNQEIFLYDLAAKKAEALALKKGINATSGSESAFSADGTRLLVLHEGPDAPKDVWTYDLASRAAKQVTDSLVAGLRGSDMVEPYLVHYPSRDGKWTISAFAYVPHNIPREGKSAAVVYIHGGPQSQSVNSFNRIIQYLLNQGYLVIAPNYRGGTGFGKEFMTANRRDAGGAELHDVLDAAEWIKRTGYVDPKKLIVMGGSYGGYLSMMAVTKAPEMWAAGVPIVPFVNWFTEFANEDPALQESDRDFMGDSVKDKELWTDRSPIFFVDRIKAPLLLLAGGNDPRCPKSEAQQVADEVRKRGGVAELKIYENEGHGFSRVENQIDAYRRVAEFLKKHVPTTPCETVCALE